MKIVTDQVNQEGQNKPKKGAIVVSDLNEEQFLKSFIVKKGGGGNRSVVNSQLKEARVASIKENVLPGDKMCTIDLTDAYFAIPNSVKSRKHAYSREKTFFMSFVAFALFFLQLLWSLQCC